MEYTKLQLVRDRNFGDLFDLSIAFIKENFALYTKTILSCLLPFLVVGGFLSLFMISDIIYLISLEDNPENFDINAFEPTKFFIGFGVIAITFFVAYIFIMTVSAKYVQMYVHENNIHQFSVGEILSAAKGEIPWVLGYILFLFVAMMVGVFSIALLFGLIGSVINGAFLVIPGIILFIVFMYALYALMLIIPLKMEQPELGIFEAIRECFRLIKNNWWKCFGMILVFNIVAGIVSYVFYIPMYAIIYSFHLFDAGSIAYYLGAIGIGVLYALAIASTFYVYLVISIVFYSLYDKLSNQSILEQIETIGTNYDEADGLESI